MDKAVLVFLLLTFWFISFLFAPMNFFPIVVIILLVDFMGFFLPNCTSQVCVYVFNETSYTSFAKLDNISSSGCFPYWPLGWFSFLAITDNSRATLTERPLMKWLFIYFPLLLLWWPTSTPEACPHGYTQNSCSHHCISFSPEQGRGYWTCFNLYIFLKS